MRLAGKNNPRAQGSLAGAWPEARRAKLTSGARRRETLNSSPPAR
jgi:hypothetical protein